MDKRDFEILMNSLYSNNQLFIPQEQNIKEWVDNAFVEKQEEETLTCDIKQEKNKITIDFIIDSRKFGADEMIDGYVLTPERLLKILQNQDDYTDNEL